VPPFANYIALVDDSVKVEVSYSRSKSIIDIDL